MMKKFLTLLCALMLLIGISGSANATVVIDPTTGWDGYFAWHDGLGPMDAISLVEFDYDWGVDTDWSITVGSDSLMSLATAWDDYIPGDEFELYVDGSSLAWTSTYEVSGYFHGEYEDLFLSAGSHSLSFYVTALAGEGSIESGAAHALFSEISPVPEPTTLVLLGLGLLGLVSISRGKTRK